MAEIIKHFKIEDLTIEVKTVYGLSENLYNQITNNASFDISFSANVY